MKMNMKNFKEFLNKASVNYLIPGISMTMDKEQITSSLISADGHAIVFMKWPNTIINEPKKEEFEFNFADISTNIKPYIDLIKDDIVDLQIKENYILIKDSTKKNVKMFFCTKEFTNHFSGQDKSKTLDYFYESQMTKELINKINEIKKIALRFGKVYLVCKEGKLYLESTDKTNSFSNSVDLEMDNIDKELDMTVCFNFKNLNHILNIIEKDIEKFTMKCTYIKESEAGLILFENGDKEKYFITSVSE